MLSQSSKLFSGSSSAPELSWVSSPVAVVSQLKLGPAVTSVPTTTSSPVGFVSSAPLAHGPTQFPSWLISALTFVVFGALHVAPSTVPFPFQSTGPNPYAPPSMPAHSSRPGNGGTAAGLRRSSSEGSAKRE